MLRSSIMTPAAFHGKNAVFPLTRGAGVRSRSRRGKGPFQRHFDPERRCDMCRNPGVYRTRPKSTASANSPALPEQINVSVVDLLREADTHVESRRKSRIVSAKHRQRRDRKEEQSNRNICSGCSTVPRNRFPALPEIFSVAVGHKIRNNLTHGIRNRSFSDCRTVSEFSP